jgi:hypothetical protein
MDYFARAAGSFILEIVLQQNKRIANHSFYLPYFS